MRMTTTSRTTMMVSSGSSAFNHAAENGLLPLVSCAQMCADPVLLILDGQNEREIALVTQIASVFVRIPVVISWALQSHCKNVFLALVSVLPGALVGAFLGTHTNDYYAPDM